MRIDGRVAIITGAASGIGEATTRLFTSEGAQVLAVDLSTSNLRGVHAGNGRVHCFECDVTTSNAPAEIVQAALSRFGRLDILMNNAGIGGRQPIESMEIEFWDRTLATNLTAHFKLSQQAIPHLKTSRAGRIINIASIMDEANDIGLSAYCTSKAGVASLTRSLALELGRSGITANYIEPGVTRTGMSSFNNRPELEERFAKKTPLNRIGEPIDIARAALFLASDESSFITGHGLRVDGGIRLRL
jgi:3-oxoacyl-[acyl-carrier protein] reductase